MPRGTEVTVTGHVCPGTALAWPVPDLARAGEGGPEELREPAPRHTEGPAEAAPPCETW